MLEVLRLVPRRDRTLTGARNRENTSSPIFFVKIEGEGRVSGRKLIIENMEERYKNRCPRK